MSKIISDKFNNNDFLTSDEINKELTTSYIGRKIIHFDTIDSTNAYAKMVGSSCEDGTTVTCEKQTAGRGRLGRPWNAETKSVCMSIILKPEISILKASKITQVCAAAISLALSEIGIESKIKWPNDLMVNNKKICGILTEMECNCNIIDYIIVGIGINVNNSCSDIPDDIKDIASSLKIETGKEIKRSSIAAGIMNKFEMLYNEFDKNDNFKKSLEICRSRSNVIGRNIKLIKNNKVKFAKAIDLGGDGDLIVQYENGEKDSIISGEISVRMID